MGFVPEGLWQELGSLFMAAGVSLSENEYDCAGFTDPEMVCVCARASEGLCVLWGGGGGMYCVCILY